MSLIDFFKKFFSTETFLNGKKGYLAISWLSMVILFTLLPIHHDISGPIVFSLLFSMLALPEKNIFFSNLAKNKIFIFFILFASSALISCFINTDFLREYIRIILWFTCLTSGLIFSYIFPQHKFRFLFCMVVVFLISSAILMLCPPAQHITHDIWQDNRLRLLTMHPSRLSLFAAFTSMYCTNLFLNSSNKFTKLVCFISVIFFCTLIYLAACRTIIVFIPFALAMIVIIRNKKNLLPSLAITAMIIIMAGTTVYIKRDSFHAKRIISAVTKTTKDPTFRARLPIWDAGWAAFRNAPLFGQGVKSFLAFYDEYRPDHTKQWHEKYGTDGQKRTKQVHNLILSRLAETGIFGTVLFFLFYSFSTWTICTGPQPYRWVGAFLVFYFLIGSFDDMLYRVDDSFIFLVIGLAAVPGKMLLPARQTDISISRSQSINDAPSLK